MAAANEFERLIEIMDRLREECPWDRAQTPQSLLQYMIEEVYEVIDSVNQEDWEHLQKELGDVLLHIVFQTKIAEENNRFTMESVIKNINEKLVRRHPHVFGDQKIGEDEDIETIWEGIKKEKEGKKSYVDGVPKAMPALLRANNIQRKAAATGFDWQSVKEVLPKLDEEICEFNEAVQNENRQQVEDELGDILFTFVNIARHLDVNGEIALARATDKFERRFRLLEAEIARQGVEIKDRNPDELDKLWKQIKSGEN